ncbi:hypothetical protein V6N13_148178 [Hibiscus sabdariffa]
MIAESGHELEVLGFLILLASFQLVGAFDTDELVNFLEFFAQHIQTPELFKVLGLGDKTTGAQSWARAWKLGLSPRPRSIWVQRTSNGSAWKGRFG